MEKRGNRRRLIPLVSFRGCTVVSCGTLRRELMHLKESGFLDADRILFTAPGLHESPMELKKQLLSQLKKATDLSERVIVVFGSLCYVTVSDPRSIDEITQEFGPGVCRVDAKNCIDMLASAEERERFSEGKKIYWLPPGWFEYSKVVFKKWDKGMANETFPQHDIALMLDSLDLFERFSAESPERILEFSDWMGIPMDSKKISLERLKSLLSGCLKR